MKYSDKLSVEIREIDFFSNFKNLRRVSWSAHRRYSL